MASQFQNRLVGISILVASVVIFLPTIIDGKKTAYEDEFVSTPIHPEIKKHKQVRPESNDVLSDDIEIVTSSAPEPIRQAETVDEQWQVEEIASTVTIDKKVQSAQTKPKVAEKVQLAKSPTVKVNSTKQKKKLPDTAWTIQLGAFQNAANINSLLKTLHKAGFQAHTVPNDVIDGQLTRVFVGPDVSKSKLEKQLPRLKRLTKLEGKLYPFDAVNP
ncbi:SPOR domain-containing protein [Psychromonas sp. Urea-02u-13]|uniref:SPOR domain-containing protein n=1 Tax=Psychromonas sp. Urea-02u-13 TaxID=2058326 RepID=UPI000C333C01|nr:SPOR domain-containing protein [Psychromonas sp. Urea-02u-13]PKG39610.1 sporulation protein [Psychromonas sp. Urea-02u-13]